MSVKLSGKYQKRWVLVGLCLFGVLLMLPPAGGVRGFCRRAARPVLVPMSIFGSHVTVHLRSRMDEMTVSSSPDADEQAQALRGQILLMRQMIEDQRREIRTLTKWNGTLEGFRCRLLPARVIAADPLSLRNHRLIGVGSRKGVGPGDLVTTRRIIHESASPLPDKLTVLGRNYVVGCVSNSSACSATLTLVTDPHFKASAKLWRMVEPGGQRTIFLAVKTGGVEKRTFEHSRTSPGPEPVGNPIPVEAIGNGREVVLEHVPFNHNVRAGDILTSAGSSGLFPLGLTIGRVSRVERDKNDAHFVMVFVEPLADLQRLQNVYIVLPDEQVEMGQ
ncbi:MAG: rod shape-determining protein MreC [Phycisphaerae bacterium]|nr:rod shape-determining protein MreC [Phycisphaerae bacterium]